MGVEMAPPLSKKKHLRFLWFKEAESEKIDNLK